MDDKNAIWYSRFLVKEEGIGKAKKLVKLHIFFDE